MTKGQAEAALTAAVTQFERDHLGRGPREARTFIVQDTVVVRVRGILSPAEQQLAQDAEGTALLKQVRSRLVESARDRLCAMVVERLGASVDAFHTDFSTRTGERVFVFTMDRDVEAALGDR
jgi:uncharacterized protein YbcI